MQPSAARDVQDVTFTSAALDRPMKYRVILPESYARPKTRFPVLYLLHGLDGHFDDFATRTHLVERARRLPFVIVMPEGGDSWYVNAADGSGRFEDYIATDLVREVESRFRVIRAGYGRAIAGLSMGGYGAIRIALTHPGTFVAAGSLSGAFDAPEPSFADVFPAHTAEMGRLFGPAESETRRTGDIYAAAERVAVASAPRLYVACGAADRFLESNRRLVAIVQKRGLTYEYHETRGGHGWDYWNRSVDGLLAWATDAFTAAGRR
jgi:S-formylglutathione hydrolase FrmB